MRQSQNIIEDDTWPLLPIDNVGQATGGYRGWAVTQETGSTPGVCSPSPLLTSLPAMEEDRRQGHRQAKVGLAAENSSSPFSSFHAILPWGLLGWEGEGGLSCLQAPHCLPHIFYNRKVVPSLKISPPLKTAKMKF